MANITVSNNARTTNNYLQINFTTDISNISKIELTNDGVNYISATSYTNNSATFNVSGWSNGTYNNCQLRVVYEEEVVVPITLNNISNMTATKGQSFNILYSTNIAAVKHEISWNDKGTFMDITNQITSESSLNYKYIHDAETNYDSIKITIRVTDANGNTSSKSFTVTFTEAPVISNDTIELTDIVSYYQQPTQNAVNEINSLSATDYVSFVVLTDMHMNNNSGNSQNIVRYILKNTSANKFFCLGDLSVNQPSLQEYQTAMRPFIDNCRDNLYYTRGNHDYPWSGTDEVPLEKLYSDMLEGRSNLIGHPEKLYYYVDDTDKKVRFLVLNTSDESDENVSNTQLQWIDSAVQLPNSDWKLAVFSHINIDLNHPYLIGAVSQASQIVQKIKATNGTIIGHFCGHQHVDDISVIDNAFYQVVFLGDTYEPYYGYADYNVPPDRNTGTVSEQAVSIVSANLNTGDVTIRRIGAGSNQSYNYKSLSSDPGETTSYSITNNLTNCTNGNTVTSITSGSSYSGTITANSGYTLGTITVTMGGTDISSSAVNANSINISSVTGNIVITATATANAETPGKEWTSGVAYNLSIVADSYVEKDGAITAYTDWSRTDYTNCAGASKLVTNSTWEANYCCFYDSNKNFISTFTIPNGNGEITVPSNAVYFIASAETSTMAAMVITPY